MSLLFDPSQPLPGGYVFKPLSPEICSLLERAGVPMPEILTISQREIRKIKGTRDMKKKGYWAGQALARVAPILSRNLDDINLLVFATVADYDRVRAASELGRAGFLAKAKLEFSKLPPGQFGPLARQAGAHFFNWLFAGGEGVLR